MAILSKRAKKAFYNKAVPSRNLWTTIPGVVTSVLSILVLLNVISLDQSAELQGYVLTLTEAITAVLGVITGIIAMFKATDSTPVEPVV